MKILITTEPNTDGFGDIFSAKRMYFLLKELHPEWDVQLLILPSYHSFGGGAIKPEILNNISLKHNSVTGDELIKFNPDIIVDVAGNGLTRTDYSKAVLTKYIDWRNRPYIHVNEMSNIGESINQFMRVSNTEQLDITLKSELGVKLPPPLQKKLLEGDYFFSYGRSNQTNSYYINSLLSQYPDKRPLIVVMPGARHMELTLPPTCKVEYLDYNAENLMDDRTTHNPDLIIIKGAIESNDFKSLIKNTRYDHVLATGDMSIIEALSFGKVPFQDFHRRLFPRTIYSEHAELFYLPTDGPINLGKLNYFLQNSQIKQDILRNFSKHSKLGEYTAEKIEKKYAHRFFYLGMDLEISEPFSLSLLIDKIKKIPYEQFIQELNDLPDRVFKAKITESDYIKLFQYQTKEDTYYFKMVYLHKKGYYRLPTIMEENLNFYEFLSTPSLSDLYGKWKKKEISDINFIKNALQLHNQSIEQTFKFRFFSYFTTMSLNVHLSKNIIDFIDKLPYEYNKDELIKFINVQMSQSKFEIKPKDSLFNYLKMIAIVSKMQLHTNADGCIESIISDNAGFMSEKITLTITS